MTTAQTIDTYERFMISQVAVLIRDGKVLILEDARHPGFWALPGGRIDKQEAATVGFARELKEELDLDTFKTVKMLDMDIWYTKNKNVPYCAVAYLIETDQQDFQLSFEHLQSKWVTEDELSDVPFLWDCAERLLRSGFAAAR